MAAPKIVALGVYRLRFDESAVEGHLATLCPPYESKLRADIREMLASTVLVELLLTDRDSRFDAGDFKQSATSKDWSWLYPVGLVWVWHLTADGLQRLVFDDEDDDLEPPLSFTTFRAAIHFRGWDEAQPLHTSYGPVSCPAASAIPERLLRLAPYQSGD